VVPGHVQEGQRVVEEAQIHALTLGARDRPDHAFAPTRHPACGFPHPTASPIVRPVAPGRAAGAVGAGDGSS
jgi:hypothetical protein